MSCAVHVTLGFFGSVCFTHTRQENEEAMPSSHARTMKKPAASKILKKPSVSSQARAARKDKSRKAKLAVKNQRAAENARARARRAARSKKPYQPRDVKLQAIAMETLRATEAAQAASEKADKAHAAAEEAQSRCQQVGDATATSIKKSMEVAVQAREEASTTARLVTDKLEKAEADATLALRTARMASAATFKF